MRAAVLASLLGLICVATHAAEHKAVTPAGPKPVGPYSPGLAAGGLIYVSGQGARNASNQLPSTPEEQIRQCLENVKGVLTAAGAGMDHVVFAHVYLADLKNYNLLNQLWAKYFPSDPPARSVVGVTRMPTGTPVEIAAIAVSDIKRKKTVVVPGTRIQEPVSAAVAIGDRVFLTGGVGRDVKGTIPKDARGQVKVVIDGAEAALKQAGLDLRHLIYANIYVDAAMPMKELGAVLDDAIPDETARTIVQTNALPFGTHIMISGVASRVLNRAGGHCSSVDDTVYCSARVGTIRQALDSLKADLQVAGFDLTTTVAAIVYMDDLDEFPAMNQIYGTYFGKVPPTRTTVQPWKHVADLALPPTTGVGPETDNSPRVQIAIIAVR